MANLALAMLGIWHTKTGTNLARCVMNVFAEGPAVEPC